MNQQDKNEYEEFGNHAVSSVEMSEQPQDAQKFSVQDEQKETDSKKKWRWLGIGLASFVVLLIVAGGAYYFFFLQSGKDAARAYTIPAVPIINVFTLNGANRNVHIADSTAAVLSVIDYWEHLSDAEYQQIITDARRAGFGQYSVLWLRDTVKPFIERAGDFTVHLEQIPITELDRYINEDVRTPLITYTRLDLSKGPNDVVYSPMSVLIGVDEERKVLTFHHFWYGNNYEISFADYRTMQEHFLPELQNRYVVVQPQIGKAEKLDRIAQSAGTYPDRTSVMEKAAPMMRNIALAWGGLRVGNFGLVQESIQAVEGDPNFSNTLHPFFKALAYGFRAQAFIFQDDLDQAEQYAKNALAVNEDFDQPFNGWPAVEAGINGSDVLDRFAGPHWLLGDIARLRGNLKEARASYEKALEIAPEHPRAVAGLEALAGE